MDFKEIAKKRQQKWDEKKVYKTKETKDKPKFYVLDMFPYPSGVGLHVGHPKGYIATDVIARKKMLQGYNVLHPMGFDTFGLGTENYAIKHKVKPQDAATKNINRYIEQLKMFGCTYDWDRSFSTADPDYYKWTQTIFLRFYNHYFDEESNKAMPISHLEQKIKDKEISIPQDMTIDQYLNSQRLAYIDYKPINRCPQCKTGLANEDLEDGKCERCGSEIEQKPMKQRVLRITKYADRLLDDLELLPNRSKSDKDMQINWIGKSTGTQLEFKIDGFEEDTISVYTTRIDTIFGATFIVLAPEHPLVDKITTSEHKSEVNKYQENANKKTQLERLGLQKDKTGVFTGAYAINPFNNAKMPIWIADYVMMGYGTGAIMAVPAHDERDYDFAKKYNLQIIDVISPEYGQSKQPDEKIVEGISSILFDPNTQKYGVILDPLHPVRKYSLISGGKKEGESFEECLIREIKEEAGVDDIKRTIPLLERMYSRYFHAKKKYNIRGVFVPYLVVLNSLHSIEQNLEEHEKGYEIVWLDGKQIHDYFAKLPEGHADHWLRTIKMAIHKAIALGLDKKTNIKDIPLSIITDKGILINSGEYTGLHSDDAITQMQKYLEDNGLGHTQSHYKLQDWVFSRQRYWGEPIPVVHCPVCGVVSMDENDLPLELPDVENYEPTGSEEGPLFNIKSWINTTCPKCGGQAHRESNTMPGRAGSSRYWLRYMDPHNTQEILYSDKEKYWKNVDVYVGGAEHITRHMIYARFWQKFLFDIGIVSELEPFNTYQKVGLIMAEDGRKMSKRWGNVINPDDIINEFGTDTLRVYEMFIGPFDQAIAWNTNGLKGVKKFLDKVVKLQTLLKDSSEKKTEYQSILHQTIKKVTEDIDKFSFNTAISQLMILVNKLISVGELDKETFSILIILLSPFAPHIAEELWEKLGNTQMLFQIAQWPDYDSSLISEEEITIAVQFKGKVRGTIKINKDASQEDVLENIKEDDKLSKYLPEDIRKIIYIPSKIINII